MSKITRSADDLNIAELTSTDIQILRNIANATASASVFAGDNNDTGSILLNKIITAIIDKKLCSVPQQSEFKEEFNNVWQSYKPNFFDEKTVEKIQLQAALTLPRVDTEEIGDLLEVTNKEYNYPVNPANNRRIGWETARRYLNRKMATYISSIS